MKKTILSFMLSAGYLLSLAQNLQNNATSNHGNKFEQLGTILPTPNEYRAASGAPGHKYWQQRCDYDIKCTLDEKNLKLTGSELVTYYNNSPDVLTYLWLQLDENQHSTVNNANYQTSSALGKQTAFDKTMFDREAEKLTDNGYGHIIANIQDAVTAKKLNYTINKTMMRVELPTPLKPGQKFSFKLDWYYKISDRNVKNGRGGYEFFPEDGNHIFTITQWYPRLCVYNDYAGWQNQQFIGTGEFTLTFGNFNVQITAPADHIVMATGECTNYDNILTPAQKARWAKAQTTKEPIEIANLEEAKKAETQKANTTKTWKFTANMVRDFAFGSSRKFVWDAMPAYVEGKKIMCMSAYPKESYSLYKKYSTKAVAHTIKTYSHFTIPYPYPVAQSIEAANGMEYPMICFNYGRTEKDGTYSEAIKYGMLGVIIHEVGHNFFPMIINSDERQWSWMDEGLNTFTQYLSEELWDNKIPSRRGPAHTIVDYMKLPKEQLEPIMTNSENIINFGANAYSKPATGLNILRETVMGRKLFDYAFKEYARRWAFKHPTPADFFRTMEDASAEDLDWFWRGWFYGIEPCDIAIDSVKHLAYNASVSIVDTSKPRYTKKDLQVAKPMLPEFDDISKQLNRADKSIVFAVDADTTLRDFYWRYAQGLIAYDSSISINPAAKRERESLSEQEKQAFANTHLYEINFLNKGGLVMPIIVEFEFEDGSKQTEKIPAQIWRRNEKQVSKVFITNKKVVKIQLDPMKETADIDTKNNLWMLEAGKDAPTNFGIFKAKAAGVRSMNGSNNPMQLLGGK